MVATRLIISGQRDLVCPVSTITHAILRLGWRVDQVVSGGGAGIDACGEAWARRYAHPVQVFPAEWVTDGRHAGVRRDRRMVQYATHALVVWRGHRPPPGVQGLVDEATRQGLPSAALREADDGSFILGAVDIGPGPRPSYGHERRSCPQPAQAGRHRRRWRVGTSG